MNISMYASHLHMYIILLCMTLCRCMLKHELNLYTLELSIYQSRGQWEKQSISYQIRFRFVVRIHSGVLHITHVYCLS